MFDASNLDFLEIDSERESKKSSNDSSDHRQGEDQWEINMTVSKHGLHGFLIGASSCDFVDHLFCPREERSTKSHESTRIKETATRV